MDGWKGGESLEEQITHPPEVEVLVEELIILKLDVTGQLKK